MSKGNHRVPDKFPQESEIVRCRATMSKYGANMGSYIIKCLVSDFLRTFCIRPFI